MLKQQTGQSGRCLVAVGVCGTLVLVPPHVVLPREHLPARVARAHVLTSVQFLVPPQIVRSCKPVRNQYFFICMLVSLKLNIFVVV